MLLFHTSVMLYKTIGSSCYLVCLSRKLKLWHGENARAICEFDCHLSPLSCVAITEEGELIASGDKMGNIFLWRIDEPDWKVELESELTESISELQFVYK